MDSLVPDVSLSVKSSGPYAIGPRQDEGQVSSIIQCVGKHKQTHEFVTLKMLQMMEVDDDDDDEGVSQELLQAKILLYNEHKLLSLLQGEPGVIGLRDFFMEDTYEEDDEDDDEDYDDDDEDIAMTPVQTPSEETTLSTPDELVQTSSHSLDVHLSQFDAESSSDSLRLREARELSRFGRRRRPRFERRCPRLTLVTDCCHAHDLDPDSDRFVTIQHYVIQERQLTEKEGLKLFHGILRCVANLHRLGVIHRDLKLGNVAFDRAHDDVVLSNFCLGRHLINDDELLTDQRGSPAYISPEVLSGNPYKGKPSDIWALGVMLYTMMYGRFPFYDHDPRKLFRKIKTADFHIPLDERIGESSHDLMNKLLRLDPETRLTADEALDAVESVFASWHGLATSPLTLQVVPDVDDVPREEALANQVVPSGAASSDPYSFAIGQSSAQELPLASNQELTIPHVAISIEVTHREPPQDLTRPNHDHLSLHPTLPSSMDARSLLISDYQNSSNVSVIQSHRQVMSQVTSLASGLLARETSNGFFIPVALEDENSVLDLSRSFVTS